MREGLEDYLRQYNEIAKQELDSQSEDLLEPEKEVQQSEIDQAVNDIFTNVVARAISGKKPSFENAQKVYELQIQKQEIMRQLHTDFENLNNPEYWQNKSGIKIIRNGEGQLMRKNKKTPITIGEVVTDENWGMKYTLDPSTCTRHEMKLWLVERAKDRLRELLDQQQVDDALSRGDRREAGNYKVIIANHKRMSKFNPEDLRDFGIIAEKFVRNYIVKIGIDFDVDFEVIDADAEMDVNKKIDLIIKRKLHRRGVKIEKNASQSNQNFGVQVTVSKKASVLEHKRQQIQAVRESILNENEIQDMVLVQFSRDVVTNMVNAYKQWDKDKNTGGPDKLLPVEIKEALFKQLLQGMYTPEELDERWGAIVGAEGNEDSAEVIAA